MELKYYKVTSLQTNALQSICSFLHYLHWDTVFLAQSRFKYGGCELHVVTLLNRTPTVAWYMERLGGKNGHQKVTNESSIWLLILLVFLLQFWNLKWRSFCDLELLSCVEYSGSGPPALLTWLFAEMIVPTMGPHTFILPSGERNGGCHPPCPSCT